MGRYPTFHFSGSAIKCHSLGELTSPWHPPLDLARCFNLLYIQYSIAQRYYLCLLSPWEVTASSIKVGKKLERTVVCAQYWFQHQKLDVLLEMEMIPAWIGFIEVGASATLYQLGKQKLLVRIDRQVKQAALEIMNAFPERTVSSAGAPFGEAKQ